MKIIVIGGGAAGMSAASKIKRENKDYNVTVIEKSGFVSYAECGMPYYLAGFFDKYEDLLHYPISEFIEKRGINVLINTEAKEIDVENKTVKTEDKNFHYDKLILATGATPRIPDSFNNFVYSLRSMNDAIRIKSKLALSKNITIVGAGVLGTELFSLLKGKYKVKLISKHERILPFLDDDMGNVLNEIIKKSDVDIEYNSIPEDFTVDGNGTLIKTHIGKHRSDLVIFTAGISPENIIAKNAGIKMNGHNMIVTDDYLHTSRDDVFAAGDNVTSKNMVTGNNDYFPLAQVANKMGRTIGTNINKDLRKFPGALGTTIINVFGFQVGYTGLNEKKARTLNYNFDTVLIHGKSKSNYLNGNDVHLKILFDRKDGKLLGAQIIDKDNGAWRLNTLATAISAKMDLYDIVYSDLGYEPEYGPVWDPLIIASSLGLDKISEIS